MTDSLKRLRVALLLLVAVAGGAARAQNIIPDLFGTQPPTAQVPAQPAGNILPPPGTGAATVVQPVPTAAPATTAPRDALVVVAPAPAGKVFGSQIFGGTFRGTLNPGFNADYVLAIGDRIQVRLWGAFNYEAFVNVDPQGNVYVPNVGPIAVAGVRSGALNAVMERGIRRTFRNNVGVYAALDLSQPVKVYVTGFVRQPGLYAGVASDSPISFVDKAGGVDPERGSYIDITIKRGGQVRKQLNLYDFLLDGKLDVAQFQDGDVVVVGPRQNALSIDGDVYNAYEFEFLEPSVPLRRLLALAKVKPGATHVSIQRRQGAVRRSEYFPLADADRVVLNAGDDVTVTTDRSRGTIQVRIDGAHAGEHAIVLPYGATMDQVLARIRPNAMSKVDSLQLYRKSVAERQKEMLLTALRKIEETALSARSKTNEEAGLRTKEAELILQFVDRARKIEPRGQVVLSAAQRGATLLEDGDVVVVPERTSLVMVHGEVLFPNAVSWEKRLGVQDYIRQAGGYTQSADTSKVVLIRQNGATSLVDKVADVQPGDEIMALPRIETKNYEVTRALTQILYQIAFTARVAFGLF